VCAAVEEIPGVRIAQYDNESGIFSVYYDENRLGLEEIFAAVFRAGKKMGKDYLPEVAAE
jgi:copper chaperone CopZ